MSDRTFVLPAPPNQYSKDYSSQLNRRIEEFLKDINQGSQTPTGGSAEFSTIAVAGQGDVVADGHGDTVTFVAGPNITITTDPTNDKITFSAATSGGSTLADGDYGDIVVSGSGTIMSIDSTVITPAARTVLDDASLVAMLATLGGQPLDSDLTAIAVLTPTNDDIIQRKAGAWTNRTIAQYKTDLGLSGANTGDETAAGILAKLITVDGSGSTLDADTLDGHDSSFYATASSLAGYQPLDADLTTISGLVATTDNFMQAKAGAWASRTVAQVKTDLSLTGVNSGDETAAGILAKLVTVDGSGSGLDADLLDGHDTSFFATSASLSGYQPLDSDLTVISGLTPVPDDFLQWKAGAWVNRTVAQVKTDLNLSGSNSGDETAATILTKVKTVDGTGSGLDADLLDGLDSTAFALTSALAGYQPLDSDLTVIAGLTATTDNFMQAKAGAWASRTVAQVKTDLSLSGSNTGDETAASLLTKLLTVDGAGSTLDADTLDGHDSTFFATASSLSGYQPLDSDLTTIAGLTATTDSFMQAKAGVWAARTIAQVQADLGITGANNFGTIAVSGQSNVVADAPNDTLTLVAGANIVITTNAATDTITISSTGSGGGATLADGDYGDIVVSGTGTAINIDSTVITTAARTVLDDTSVSAMLATLGGQPLDSDLTTIAGLTATTDSFMQSKAGAWAARTIAQVKTDLGLTGTNSGDETAASVLAKLITVDGTGSGLDADLLDGLDSTAFALSSSLSGYQPLDSDLTTISGLVATTDNFIQSKAGAWASRTVAQVKTDLGLTGTNSGDETASTILTKLLTVDGTGSLLDADLLDGHDSSFFATASSLTGYQPLDSDLTVISGLVPALDDFLQWKAGAWANRTVAQVKTDLSLTGTNSGDETASTILTKIKTVDGTGSGLDADLLDGLDSTSFALASALGGYQPLDSDLTVIAGLAATTDNFIQSKLGAWASRTIAQVKTDLSLTGTNSGDETASTILTKLLTVDGVGSLLDADLLDGHDASFFQVAGSYQPLDSDLTVIAGLTATTDNFIQSKAGAWASRTIAQVKTDLGLTGTNSGDETAATILAKLITVDGTGSGLDADTLDGINSTAFEQTANKNVANGYAGLDSGGKVAAAQLPAYVDDVLEFANLAAFPVTGTTGIIYVDLSTNKVYRWGGSSYTEISPSPGSTDAVPEGSTNLYFTPARVLATVLSGLSTATNVAITAADTVLSAFGKLQSQFNAHVGSGGASHALATTSVAGFMSAADKTTIGGLSGVYQPLDSDLTTIAGLTATTDSFMQSKAGAWAARTIAQVKTDLSLTGVNSGDETAGSILSKLVTVDGAGSGLDADLLDGHDTSYFATASSVVPHCFTPFDPGFGGVGDGSTNDAAAINAMAAAGIASLDTPTDTGKAIMDLCGKQWKILSPLNFTYFRGSYPISLSDGAIIADVGQRTSTTGTLAANPFSTTSGSKTVNVTHTAHGLKIGQAVNYSGATAVGGITIAGDYIVKSVPNSSHYTISHLVNASSSATGGGSAVVYIYTSYKVVLDMTGTQEFQLYNLTISTKKAAVTIVGGLPNVPDVGIVHQRNTTSTGVVKTVAGNHHEQVRIRGTYAKACCQNYSSEIFSSHKSMYSNEAKYSQFPNAYAFILQRTEKPFLYVSPFLDPTESATIDNQSFNIHTFHDARFFRTNPNSWEFTQIDKLNPGKVYCDFSGGDTPVIGDQFTFELDSGVTGMSELNNQCWRVGVVTPVDATHCTFLLCNTDGTDKSTVGFSTYISGTAQLYYRTGTPVLLEEDDRFTCTHVYCQTYGGNAMELLPNGSTSRATIISGHCEGSVINSWLYFNFGPNNPTGETQQTYDGFQFYEHQSQVIGTIFSTSAIGNGGPRFRNSSFILGGIDNVQTATAFFDKPAQYYLYDCYIELPDSVLEPTDYSAFGYFTGRVHIRNEDRTTYVREGKIIYHDIMDQVTHANLGTRALGNLMLYGGGNNLLLWSEQADNAYWTKNASIITANTTIAPDGSLTADTLADDNATGGTSGIHTLRKAGLGSSSNVLHCFSMFVKPNLSSELAIFLMDDASILNSINVFFDLTHESINNFNQLNPANTGATNNSGQANIVKFPNGWYRIWVSGIPNMAGGAFCRAEIRLTNKYSDNYNAATFPKSVYVWGMQLDPNVSYPGPYTKTTSASVTSDIARITSGVALDISSPTLTINGSAIPGGETGASILAKLAPVDGAGSGLDADTLDGQHGAFYAPIASPAFTGTPTSPTPTAGDNSTKIATTAFLAGGYQPVSPILSEIVISSTGTGSDALDLVRNADLGSAAYVDIRDILDLQEPTFWGDAGNASGDIIIDGGIAAQAVFENTLDGGGAVWPQN